MHIVRDAGEMYDENEMIEGEEEDDAEADEIVEKFTSRLARDNERASPPSRRLKPNLSREWLEKISRTLEVWRLITNHSHSTS